MDVFVQNNPRIDTAVLAKRINAELASLRGVGSNSAGSRLRNFPPTQSPNPAGNPSIGELQRLGPSIARKIKQVPIVGACAAWIVWIFRVRRIARAAFDAEARIAQDAFRFEAQAARFDGLITGLEGELRSELAGLRDELASVRGEFHHQLSLIEEPLENASRQLADVRHEVMSQQQQLADVRHEVIAQQQQLAAVRHEVMFQQHRLSRFTRSMTKDADLPIQVAETVYDQRLDSFYCAFTDIFRGSRADIKQRLTVYLDRVKLAGAGQLEMPIIDIGSGRGEWLELLKENNLTAYGIDSNRLMVERCISFGLDARVDDGLAHLRNLDDASCSAITAFHVIEHLPFTIVVDVLDEALRVLQSGGILILETPNPENMRVGATTFYNDPTHRNPIAPDPLRFIVEHRGFTDVEILRLHPTPEEERLTGKGGDVELLNAILFGPRDYAILARRA